MALGASTGGTEATSVSLRRLPKNIPGMVVTQHMPPVFTNMYAQRLDTDCAVSVSYTHLDVYKRQIQDGENTRVIEAKLNAFIADADLNGGKKKPETAREEEEAGDDGK